MALLAYTSGTTGAAKAAMISHRNLLAMAASVTQVDRVRDSDEIVSFLPFAWVGEQLLSVAIALHTGATVNFPEEPETVREDLREIGPHVMIAPPRFWEAMCSEYQVKIADAGLAQARGRARWRSGPRRAGGRARARRQRVGAGLARCSAGLAHLLAFRTLLDKFGLSRVRYAYTGGAPLGPEIFRFFRAIGLNLKQVYGQTESSRHLRAPSRTATCGAETRGQADAGHARPHLRRRRDPHRERQRLPRLLQEPGGDRAGRWTAAWLRTGDAGLIDDARPPGDDRPPHDVLRLADGSRFSPALIENKLKFSPYVREAVVIGEGRPHVVALSRSTWATWQLGRGQPAALHHLQGPRPASPRSPR